MQLQESKIIETPNIENKIQFPSNPGLHIDELPLIDLLVHYFIVDGFDLERVHLVHFGGNQHRDNPDYVQFGDGKSAILSFEIPVHQVHSSKVGFICEFVGRCNLDHPVQHPGPQPLVNVVGYQE